MLGGPIISFMWGLPLRFFYSFGMIGIKGKHERGSKNLNKLIPNRPFHKRNNKTGRVGTGREGIISPKMATVMPQNGRL